MGRGHCRASSFFSPPAVMPVDTTCVCVAGQGPRPMAELSRGVRLSLSLSLSLSPHFHQVASPGERDTVIIIPSRSRARIVKRQLVCHLLCRGLGSGARAACYMLHYVSPERRAQCGIYDSVWFVWPYLARATFAATALGGTSMSDGRVVLLLRGTVASRAPEAWKHALFARRFYALKGTNRRENRFRITLGESRRRAALRGTGKATAPR